MEIDKALQILDGDFSEIELQEGQSHSDLFQEAFQMAKESLAMQKSMKPIHSHPCPHCGSGIVTPEFVKEEFKPFADFPKHCPDCGQKIKWEKRKNKQEQKWFDY